MHVEVRVCREDEHEEAIRTCETAFGMGVKPDDLARLRKVVPVDRTFVATDDGAIIGVGANYAFELTIPGATIPAAGLTLVGVLPSHRRRGVLRKLMHAFLEDARTHEEPVSILWASEAGIYQRFGYGYASQQLWMSAQRDRMLFLDRAPTVGRIRLISLDDAAKSVPGIYDRVRAATPGMFKRSSEWWRLHRLTDSEHHREGAGPTWCALLEVDGEPEGYAFYRIRSEWDSYPKGKVEVLEAMATGPATTRSLWQFLFGIDLVQDVEAWGLPIDHPVTLMVTEPRRLRWRMHDALWLRIVDLPAALSARSFATSERVTCAVEDDLYPDNSGSWTIDTTGTSPTVERTDAKSELSLHVRDLGAMYLGAFTAAELARADRVTEQTAGAIARFDAMFRTDVAPWCPEIF